MLYAFLVFFLVTWKQRNKKILATCCEAEFVVATKGLVVPIVNDICSDDVCVIWSRAFFAAPLITLFHFF